MPRYFFNEFAGNYKLDDRGLDLPTLEKARLEAVKYAGEAMRDQPELAWRGDEFRVEVTDEKQLVLFTVIVIGVEAPAGGYSVNPALKPRA